MDSKVCTRCNQSKKLSEFYIRNDSKSGYTSHCKLCKKYYRYSNKTKQQQYNKLYRSNNARTIKEYHINNKDKLKQYRIDNKDHISEYYKRYYQENKEHIREYRRTKYNNDSNYKLLCSLRRRLTQALNGTCKSSSTLELLGCTVEELKAYLQQTAISNGYHDFDINDYSGKEYHIDHIKPCSSFDLSDPELQRKCFHYSNLQILTAGENLSKNNHI